MYPNKIHDYLITLQCRQVEKITHMFLWLAFLTCYFKKLNHHMYIKLAQKNKMLM